jgi:hypothetical protein
MATYNTRDGIGVILICASSSSRSMAGGVYKKFEPKLPPACLGPSFRGVRVRLPQRLLDGFPL